MEEYKPIPNNATRIYLDWWNCGDDYCSCNHIAIKAVLPHPVLKCGWHTTLWESDWFSSDEWALAGTNNSYFTNEDKQKLVDSVKAACEHYNIPHNICGEDMYDYFEWKGERIL